MKPSDVFGIIVRTIGVLMLVSAGSYFLFGLAEAVGIVMEDSPQEMKAYFVGGSGSAVAAFVLLRGASWFVRFSYPNSERSQDAKESEAQ